MSRNRSKKSVTIIGRFKMGKAVSDGQSIKTRVFADEVEKLLGKNQVSCIDTDGWRKHPLGLLWQSIASVYRHKNVLLMVDQKGIRVFSPLLAALKFILRCRIHYVVIGGWLDSLLEGRSWLAFCQKRFDYVYVETNTMKSALEHRGYNNVVTMPNCKKLSSLTEEELEYNMCEPYKLCTFSRVMREKGIELAVDAVKEINRRAGRTIYKLDIYGTVDSGQTAWFETLQNSFSEDIRYCGTVSYDDSVSVLKGYFALLFPTRFYTEGIPGTIIDAFCAGVPVIASAWESYKDVLDEDSSVVYPFDNENGLLKALDDAAKKPEAFNVRKVACLSRVKEFSVDKIQEILVSRMEIN